MDSTLFLRPLLPGPGHSDAARAVGRKKSEIWTTATRSRANSAGWMWAKRVVICDGACVALEAMEGTDAVMERAASLVNGRMLRVVKLAKPNQDLRFDVPVIGPANRSS